MLHGRSNSYQVPFSSIKQFFHIPGSEKQVHVVLRIEPAIGQGNTKYSFLVMDFNKEDEAELEFEMDE